MVVHQEHEVAPSGLFGTTDPMQIITKATGVATALKAVITKQGLVSKISGKEYPRCEAWTLLGTMLGVFPVCCWTKQVPNGWEARVEARTKDGAVVGAAEAQCLRGEKNWEKRDDFALRSMAQTRATAKCLRMPLGFVMTLAGYEATPAEEMAFGEAAPDRPSPDTPQAPKTPPRPSSAQGGPSLEEYRAKMAKNLTEAEMREPAMSLLIDLAWLLPTETLEELPFKFVPQTPQEYSSLLAKIVNFHATGKAEKPYEPHHDVVDGQSAKPEENGLPPDGPCEKGEIQAVTLKEGKSAKGPWSLWGIKINDVWINTFSNTIGKLCQTLKGKSVILYYDKEEKGNKAKELVLSDGSRFKPGENS